MLLDKMKAFAHKKNLAQEGHFASTYLRLHLNHCITPVFSTWHQFLCKIKLPIIFKQAKRDDLLSMIKFYSASRFIIKLYVCQYKFDIVS